MMSPEPTIRAATLDDYAAVCRLLRELDELHVRIRPDVFRPFDDPVRQRDRVARFVDGEDAELFVAEINCEIVGLATVRVSESPDAPMFRPGRRACLDDLVVAREFQGLGIGQKLLERVRKWARARKLTSLVINVWSDNDPGLSFFTKSGFAPRCQQMEMQLEKET